MVRDAGQASMTSTAIKQILKQKNILAHQNQGILIAQIADQSQGLALANEILLQIVDDKSFLLLSGGRTPWALYETIATERKIQPGAVGMVDERFGAKWHEASNEKKMLETGLVTYLNDRKIPFYPILTDHQTRKETARDYNVKLRELFNEYEKCFGILGIGLDGHTAGIAGNREDFQNPMFVPERKNLLVSEYDDQKGMFKERVSMTFLGLSMLDLIIILVFGTDKKAALYQMFSEGTEEVIPGRFYKRAEIAKKTLLITDQKV